MDIDILYILSNRDIYYKYKDYIKDYTINKETKLILKDIDIWFKEDTTRAIIDWDSFLTWVITVQHRSLRADKLTVLTTIIERAKAHEVDETLKEAVVQSFIDRDYGTQIADHALKVAEGDTGVDLETITSLMDSWRRNSIKTTHKASLFVTEDINEILKDTVGASGYDWRMNELNIALGPLRKGNLVIIGKRPDSGGTTLLAQESTYMAKQMPEDSVVLWVNNEEAGANVRLRTIQAALARSSDDIMAEPLKAMEDYENEVGKGKIKILDNATVHIRDIQEILDNEKVGLLIFDQLWKVKGYEKDTNEVTRQTELFNQAREWAKKYAPVLAVHQADGSAQNQRWIEMNQLYGSKTAIQGEADAIVTIGRCTEPGNETTRFIYVPKNKLTGGPRSDPAQRNGRFEVTIQPEIARFK